MLSRGFTLIEVLVTLVILMFGLLGIAGLMAKGQRASFEAYQRHQALAIANDMAERMRANRSQATAYAAGAPLATPLGDGSAFATLSPIASITDCGASTCSTANLVTYDLAQWDGLLTGYAETQTASGARVGGIVGARGCIEETANTAATCPAPPAPPATLFTRINRVSVSWLGNDDTVAPTTSVNNVAVPLNCGAGLYITETRRRVVALDVMLLVQCP